MEEKIEILAKKTAETLLQIIKVHIPKYINVELDYVNSFIWSDKNALVSFNIKYNIDGFMYELSDISKFLDEIERLNYSTLKQYELTSEFKVIKRRSNYTESEDTLGLVQSVNFKSTNLVVILTNEFNVYDIIK